MIQRKSAMKKSQHWEERSNDTSGNRQHRHSTNVMYNSTANIHNNSPTNIMVDSSFSSVAD